MTSYRGFVVDGLPDDASVKYARRSRRTFSEAWKDAQKLERKPFYGPGSTIVVGVRKEEAKKAGK